MEKQSFIHKAQYLSTGHAHATMPIKTLDCVDNFGILETKIK